MGKKKTVLAASSVAAVVAVVAVAWAVGAGGSGSEAAVDQPASQSSLSPSGVDRLGATGAATSTSSPTPVGEPPASATTQAPAEPGGRRTAAPQPLRAVAIPAAGVVASLASIRHATGKAEIPGEVGGPSLDIAVQIRNRTGVPVNLTGAVVNVYYGPGRTPATMFDSAVEPLPASVAAGGSATGTYEFKVPTAAQGRVRVEVDLGAGYDVVVFAGDTRG